MDQILLGLIKPFAEQGMSVAQISDRIGVSLAELRKGGIVRAETGVKRGVKKAGTIFQAQG